MKKILTAIASASILAVSTVSSASAAGNTAFSVQANSANYTQGNTVTVSVYENGTNINTVKAVLSFDASKLSCAGIGGSASFPTDTPSTACGNGSVVISRGTTTPANGNVLVGTVSFTAVAAGSTSVNLTSAKAYEAATGTDTWNGATSITSFSIAAPAAAPVTKPTTPAPKNTVAPKVTPQAATAPQVASAATEQQPAVKAAETKAENKPAATAKSSPVINTQNTANESANALVWTTSSIGILLIALTGAYFYLTRRRPELVKSVYKRINL